MTPRQMNDIRRPAPSGTPPAPRAREVVRSTHSANATAQRPQPLLRPTAQRPASAPDLDIKRLKQTQVVMPDAKAVLASIAPAHVTPSVPILKPTVPIEKKPTPAAKPEQKAKSRHWYVRVFNIVQYPLFAAIAIAASYSTSIGQWFILGYVIIALLRRQDSRVTFAIAIFLLIAIPVFQLLQQPGVAENTAVYAYELLVFGTLQAIFEVIRSSKNKQIRV